MRVMAMSAQAVLQSIWNLLQKPLFSVSGQSISLISFFYFIVVIWVSFLLARIVVRLLKRNVYSRAELDKGVQYTLSRLARYGVIVIGFLIGLQMIGFDLSILAVFGGLFGVGIGFGLQNIFSNFASGLILLMERPVQVGDIIELDDMMGKVQEIRFRVTVVNTFDNESVIVPNEDLVSERVINWSYGGDSNLRLRLPIGVAYGSDVDKVKKILQEIAKEEPQVLDDPAPQVFFQEHADSSLNFELRVWIATPLDRITVQNNIREEIDARFREEDIEIPFPQRDVYLFNQSGEEIQETLNDLDG